MNVEYSKDFDKSVKKLSGKMLDSIRRVIAEVKNAENIKERCKIHHCSIFQHSLYNFTILTRRRIHVKLNVRTCKSLFTYNKLHIFYTNRPLAEPVVMHRIKHPVPNSHTDKF